MLKQPWPLLMLSGLIAVLWVLRDSASGLHDTSPKSQPEPPALRQDGAPVEPADPTPGRPQPDAANPFAPFSSSKELNDWIKSQTPSAAHAYWEQAVARRDAPRKLTSVEISLGTLLRGPGSTPVYATLRQGLRDAAFSPERAAQICFILSEAATAESMQILADSLQAAAHPTLRRLLLRALVEAPKRRWDDRYHVELSPPLERAWTQASDPSTLPDLAKAMAGVGAPAGIRLILHEISRLDASDSDHMQDLLRAAATQGDPRINAALDSIGLVTNSAAIDVLAEGLIQAESRPKTIVSGQILSLLVDPKATELLANWARTATDRDQGLATEWFSNLDPNEVQAELDRPRPGQKFASAAIQAVVAKAAVEAE